MRPPPAAQSFAAGIMTGLKANPRLRWGVWLIVAILWFYVVLVLRDLAHEARQSHAGTLKRLDRLQSSATETEWPARLAAVRSLRLDLENRFWNEGSIGLAQASFQDWLDQTVRLAGLQKAAITVAVQDESPPPGERTAKAGTIVAPELWKASAKLVVDFNPMSLNQFLGLLAAHPKSVMVDSLTIRGSPAPRAEMTLVAYFLKPKSLREDPASAAKAPPR